MKNILELTHIEAREYFLKEESYCNIDLPKYFSFQSLLNKLSKCNDIASLNIADANKYDDVNYTFLTNKDGKYAWRPLQLINPAIYIYLVNKITDQNNWGLIVKHFNKFQKNQKIQCCSIPITSIKNKQSNKAKSITNWWQRIEQQSLELALNYDCFLNTDIVDCYGSIYTHSIAWALHGKEQSKADLLLGKKEAKKAGVYNKIGNIIDTTLRSMQYGQTNGIPQGSVLMDFIAEMVLGYADKILNYKIKKYNRNEKKYRIQNYQILRYRDDYRIFANNHETLIKIAKLLTETLIDLNFKLNTQKTFISDNIVRDVIKPDKLYWNKSKQSKKTLQKHLFLIHSLAEKYPNSGSLSIALDKFLNRIYSLKLFKEKSTKVLVSILIDIAYKNPQTYPFIAAILSKILSLEIDKNIVDEILNLIEQKFNKIPNVGYLQIWLQRLTLKANEKKEYKELLCQKVIDDSINVWNIDWLSKDVQNIISKKSIIDRKKIEDMPQIIEPIEISIFIY
jgi:hypothetical protein